MTSAAKIVANRLNARKSTGPRSAFGKLRSRRNAFRHGLAIPISSDIAFADQIEQLSDGLAESNSQRGQAAQIAALAELELARAQHVKVQIINRAAQDLQKQNDCDDEQLLPVLAYASQLKTLAKFSRYERRALSRRNRALRALNARIPQPPTGVICWSTLFVQPVWKFNIHALVKMAIGSSRHALGGSWEFPQINGLRATLQLQGDQSGQVRFAFANGPSQEFAIVKTYDRRGGRQWVAVCPKTTKWVEDLFLKEIEQSIGTRHGLGLIYRSKHSKSMLSSASMQNIAEANVPIVYATTTLPQVNEHENSSDGLSRTRASELPKPKANLSQRSQKCAEQHQRSENWPREEPQGLLIPADHANGANFTQPFDNECQQSEGSAMPLDPTAALVSATALITEPLASESVAASVPDNVSNLKVGDALANEGKLDEALALYHVIYRVDSTKSGGGHTAKQADKALHRIGDLAFDYLLCGHFEQALTCADEALAAHPKSVNFAIRRAHSLMFLGRLEEAKAIYSRHLGKRMTSRTTCDSYIQGDFWDLRDAGRQHPLMDEMERRNFQPYEIEEYLEEDVEPLGETVGVEPAQAPVAIIRPIDIEMGDRLSAEGKLEEALLSYRRALRGCKAGLAESGADSQAQADFDLAVRGIGTLAFKFLLKHSPGQALQSIEEAMSYRPDWIWPRKIRAYALMLTARITEAKNMHRENCGKTLEHGVTWGDSIPADFDALRAAGYNLPIMDSIERDFGSKK
ncbi:MAG TPA: hypothetical protein VGF53_02650 [Pseudolabrys sp.]|jgi:tetratricopeptide (TPR) repeat protein